jgi:predicted phage terminase large subunit-like protein
VDDPHNTQEIESEAERERVLAWWQELSSTRLNDPSQSAIVVIMQRLHNDDVSGIILSSDENFEHLMIPAEYDSRRHCVTCLGWEDPRGLDDDGEPLIDPKTHLPTNQEAARILDDRDGTLMWPERFDRQSIERIKANLGPYMASGRLQQSPQPRSGGIFKREWWNLWEGKTFPALSLVVASVDGAFTAQQENDPSACTVWGIFKHQGKPRIILMDAWRRHLQMHSDPQPRLEHEIAMPGDNRDVVRRKDAAYRQRVDGSLGLVEKIAATCRRWGVQHLLIEDKASGHTAAQEMQRLYGDEEWAVQLVTPKGDKVSRALSVQPLFANGLIYAPNRDWAELTITELSQFPRGRFDGLTDATSQCLLWLRSNGLAQLDSELAADGRKRDKQRQRLRSPYPC